MLKRFWKNMPGVSASTGTEIAIGNSISLFFSQTRLNVFGSKTDMSKIVSLHVLHIVWRVKPEKSNLLPRFGGFCCTEPKKSSTLCWTESSPV